MTKFYFSIYFITASLVSFSALMPVPAHAGKGIQYVRLSPDLLKTDALFDTVVIGRPKTHYIALLKAQKKNCTLKIINVKTRKTTYTLKDSKGCPAYDLYEDGYSVYNAFEFKKFFWHNKHKIRHALKRHNISFKHLPHIRKAKKRDCVLADRMVICLKGGKIHVNTSAK